MEGKAFTGFTADLEPLLRVAAQGASRAGEDVLVQVSRDAVVFTGGDVQMGCSVLARNKWTAKILAVSAKAFADSLRDRDAGIVRFWLTESGAFAGEMLDEMQYGRGMLGAVRLA